MSFDLRPGLRWFCLGLCLIACDGGDQAGPTPPRPSEGSGRHINEIKAVAHASGSAAATYGVDRPHPLSEVEQAILSAIERGHKGDLTHDPALSAMVHDLAVASASRFDMPPTLLDALLAWHGVPDPEPAVVVVELQGVEHGCDLAAKPDCQEALDALVESVLGTLGGGGGGGQGAARWRVGVGVSAVQDGAKTRMMVALVERGIELQPIPVSVPSGGRVELRGKLLGKRAKPRIERVDPKGHWSRLAAVVGSDASIEAVV